LREDREQRPGEECGEQGGDNREQQVRDAFRPVHALVHGGRLAQDCGHQASNIMC
jgi:hypothetical protein